MFKQSKKWLYLSRFMRAYCIAAALAYFFIINEWWLAISAIAAFAASAAITHRLYRCSHCGSRLLAKWDIMTEYCPERCPSCGREVELGWKRRFRKPAPNRTVLHVSRRQLRIGIGLELGGFGLLLLGGLGKRAWPIALGFVFVFLGVLMIDRLYLCPKCRRSLLRRYDTFFGMFFTKEPRYCPDCELDIFIELELE